jgi:alpha-galactosidase
LLIGGDMSQLDEFTLNLLTNDEVNAVNQDVLGKQASRITKEVGKEIWVKELEDGSLAVGLFNLGNSNDPAELINWDQSKMLTTKIKVDWADLKISGKQQIRNLWTQKDIAVKNGAFEAEVPYHGVVFVKISPVK